MSSSSGDSVAVLIPVLRRPDSVRSVLDAFAATTPSATCYFIADPDDALERETLDAVGANTLLLGGGYAQKINYAVGQTIEPLVFLGADDLRPQDGWLDAATAELHDGIQVVGVNDLIPRPPERRSHATHFLMTREYAQAPLLDGGRGPLCEGYRAWYCDDELIATATFRGRYAYAENARVQHVHPMAGLADDDETYQLARSFRRDDQRTYAIRSDLWT